MKLDRVNRNLLNSIQRNFPLVERPFKKIGEIAGITEDEVLNRLEELKRMEYIRFIGAIINTSSLGFSSALAAFEVDSRDIDRAAQIVNSYPGVSHNYERNDRYNLWFTIATPKDIDIRKTVATLINLSEAKSHLFLPSLKVFKIGLLLDISGKDGKLILEREAVPEITGSTSYEISPVEKKVIGKVQNSIPLTTEPFNDLSAQLQLLPAELLQIIDRLIQKGIIRRYGAILHHRKLGYEYNVMACWEVPEGNIDDYGRKISSFKAVTHCYQRPVSPDWPYNLYSMIHCLSEGSCKLIVQKILEKTGIKNYKLLSSGREFKKKRLNYFDDEFYKWEDSHQQTRSYPSS